MKGIYDLSLAKELVNDGAFSLTKRPTDFLINRYEGNPKLVFKEIFSNVKESDYRKTLELENYPGTSADVYVSSYDEMDWYIKFFIEGDRAFVHVWSCNWDGCLH